MVEKHWTQPLIYHCMVSKAFCTYRNYTHTHAHIHTNAYSPALITYTCSSTNLWEPGVTSATINSEDNESLIRHNLHNMLWLCEHSDYHSFQLWKKAENTEFDPIFNTCLNVRVCVRTLLYNTLPTDWTTYPKPLQSIGSHVIRFAERDIWAKQLTAWKQRSNTSPPVYTNNHSAHLHAQINALMLPFCFKSKHIHIARTSASLACVPSV